MDQNSRKRELQDRLITARERTMWLLDFVSDDLLKLRVHDFYSPIGWHFGHIAMTEEFWTLTQAMHLPPYNFEFTHLFANIPSNPKENRVYLPDRSEIKSYMAQIQERTLAALHEADFDAADPLLANGYAWDFAHQHECQHQETIAELLQLLSKYSGEGNASAKLAAFVLSLDPVSETEMVRIPAGKFKMGSDDPYGYDNEKPAHEVEVGAFLLDKTPVTAAQWAQFIRDGGYRRQELWTEEGWSWRTEEGAEFPEYWYPGGKGYAYYDWKGMRGIHPFEPVTSISWYEADAYARWQGKRLPTEAEWEYAAAFDPIAEKTRRYPWGNRHPVSAQSDFGLCAVMHGAANAGPMPVGNSMGHSALGVHNMAGGVWEWTSSPFLPYAGFEAYPYDGYSKDHMDGNHYVCRGGSWASDGRILRCSFRNWYVPTYRQGLLGMRCAKS